MERQSTADRVAELLDWIRTGKALELRVASGLTQREIAEDCDVTRDAVLRWERNQRRPSGRNAIAYHSVLSNLASRTRGAA